MELSKFNLITHNGKRYYFYALFYTSMSNFEQNIIELKNIKLFKFENLLNLLISTAELIFLDLYGMFNRFLMRQDVTCKIIFYEMKQKDTLDNTDAVEIKNDDESLELNFIVNNIQILYRTNSDITYKVYLIHSNIIKFLQNINYTNYGNNNEKNILKILFSCYLLAGLKIGARSVSCNNCDIKIDYITNYNDNLFNVTHYLMDKLFYYKDIETSLKFIAYNILKDEYEIIDLNNYKSLPEVDNCIISPFNNTIELLKSKTQIQLATVINSTMIDSFKSLVTTNFFKFNNDKNIFEKLTLKNNKIRNILNAIDKTLEDEKKGRFNVNFLNMNFDIQRYGSYWNNDYSIYYNLTKTLLEQNTLVINVPGIISKKLGSKFLITIDRDKPINDLTDKQKAKEEVERYSGFEGVWFVGKITFLINPNAADENYFSLNLTLFKNVIKTSKQNTLNTLFKNTIKTV